MGKGVPNEREVFTQSLTHSNGVVECPANIAGFSRSPWADMTPVGMKRWKFIHLRDKVVIEWNEMSEL